MKRVIETHGAEDAPMPVAWTLAGSDSGGGAGIQADLKVFNAFHVHGCSIVTALTAQNTQAVMTVQPTSPELMRTQLEAVASDLPADAVKIGMLGNTAVCHEVISFFKALPQPPLIVLDPVLISSSGTPLLEPDALARVQSDLFPMVHLLTPNLDELEHLTEANIGVQEGAARLLETGVGSVLIKGGHRQGEQCIDYWTDGQRELSFISPRIETRSSHGTGCILSSALAAELARGRSLPEVVASAKAFLNQCLRNPLNLGKGAGPMYIGPREEAPQDQPHVEVGCAILPLC